MSDEVTFDLEIDYAKGGAAILNRKIIDLSIDQENDGMAGGIQNVGFEAHEALDMGDISTAGICFMRNMDDTNYVEIGVDVSGVFYPFIKLKAGEPWQGRLGTNAPYAKANTAAVELEYWVLED